MPKVIVYVRSGDEKFLRQRGEEPAEWVRKLVARALEKMKEAERE